MAEKIIGLIRKPSIRKTLSDRTGCFGSVLFLCGSCDHRRQDTCKTCAQGQQPGRYEVFGCACTDGLYRHRKADGIEVTGPAEDTLKGIEIDMNDFQIRH